jgi:4-hydroxy-tetrahydrodipicolinate synthase
MDINSTPLWTALVTPLNENGSIDREGLQNLVRAQEAAGNGLLILGSTGEALNLSLEERKEVLEFCLSLNPKVPTMVGVGGSELQATLEWINYLEGKNVDAYLMVTPLYAKPGEEGQYHWFKTLMDRSTRPVMLYNVPGRTCMPLNHNTVQRLADHKNLWAIKEASGSTEEFAQYRKDAPNARVYSGDDALMPDFSDLGASGLISVASNVWPSATHTYVKQCLEKRFNDKELWDRASNSLFAASNPVPAKRLLWERKEIASKIMKAPLSDLDLNNADELLACDSLINGWEAANE